ncbi:MAG: hypothetical protein ACE5J5_06200 [Candidatus Hydrothermarchaeales archaeon]
MDINTLTELLRKEKRSPYLQEVGEDFYSQLEKYINEFYKKYSEHSEERKNLEKLIVDLYNARERKVVLNALSFARRGTKPEVENLVPEEEKTLKEIMEILKIQRDKFLKFTSQTSIPKGNKKQIDEAKIGDLEKVKPELKTVEEPQTSKESEKKIFPKRTVRILEDMPQIVGVDGKTYGSFKLEDVVNLPEANAKIFIKRGVAEFIQFKD